VVRSLTSSCFRPLPARPELSPIGRDPLASSFVGTELLTSVSCARCTAVPGAAIAANSWPDRAPVHEILAKSLKLGSNSTGTSMTQHVRTFWQEEHGQDLTEYSLLIVCFVLMALVLVTTGTTTINGIWTKMDTHLTDANAAAS
jgi:Flp pilus assembly pilin Flp